MRSNSTSSAKPSGTGPVAPADAMAAAPGGARLAVRLTPKARRDAIEGAVREADGKVALKVAVSAAPVDGKANAALVALLAPALGVAKSAVSIAAGASGRRKLVFVAGDAERMRLVLNETVAAR